MKTAAPKSNASAPAAPNQTENTNGRGTAKAPVSPTLAQSFTKRLAAMYAGWKVTFIESPLESLEKSLADRLGMPQSLLERMRRNMGEEFSL